MEVLKNTDWSKINEAYQVFINTGRILPGAVRPRIEQSWLRSQAESVNPWTSRPGSVNDEEYNALLKECAGLLEISRPVLQYMYATNNHAFEDNMVNITEKSGVVLDCCTRTSSYHSPVGRKVTESRYGTSQTSIVLADPEPIEVGGAEIYKVCMQTCFGGCAPVKDASGDLIAAVTLFNNYGKIPEQPLEFVIAGADLISSLLRDKTAARRNILEANPLFTKMINYVNDFILVVDNEGRIVNANDKCLELLAEKRTDLIGKNCREFDINLGELISDSDYVNKDSFDIRVLSQQFNCLLQNNKTVKWLNNQEHTLLLFSIAEPPKPCARLVTSKIKIDVFSKIVGKSEYHDSLINLVNRAAKVQANVLVYGESGTGKEVFARAVHNASPRASKPFIALNCGSFSKDILTSELFGYEDGAFTGGKRGGKIGKFEAAHGGTILLDEIGEMPLEMQVSLLRFLQDRTITRVGGHEAKKVDVRIIAATNRNLEKHIADSLFRQDLYYRLKVVQVTLQPLRNRKDDILPIADYYVDYFATLYGLGRLSLSQEARNFLYQYNWPGNIRELANAIENAVVFVDGPEITPDLLPSEIREYQSSRLTTLNPERLEQQEKEIIIRALKAAKGNVSYAAKSIGISRNTLYRKIDKYSLHFLK